MRETIGRKAWTRGVKNEIFERQIDIKVVQIRTGANQCEQQ
jgi:hypothetical protein